MATCLQTHHQHGRVFAHHIEKTEWRRVVTAFFAVSCDQRNGARHHSGRNQLVLNVLRHGVDVNLHGQPRLKKDVVQK